MTDLLRLDVLMNYGFIGVGTVRWHPLAFSPDLPHNRARIALAALHYGQILAIHRASRDELFRRVGSAAQGLVNGVSRRPTSTTGQCG